MSELCRFHALGSCVYEDKCRYSHEVSRESVSPCKFFAREGSCRYGDRCFFSHEQMPKKNEDNCSICFDPVLDNYGLLVNCDHLFCLDCLRTWRGSKEASKEAKRSCPLCRSISDFIVPSKVFLTGKAKESMIKNYKKWLGTRPCKYFDPESLTSSCPFGPECFYAHMTSEGVDVKHFEDPRINRRGSRGPMDDYQALFESIDELLFELQDGDHTGMSILERIQFIGY